MFIPRLSLEHRSRSLSRILRITEISTSRLFQIIPFLALGLGVDDMFLMASSFASIAQKKEIQHEVTISNIATRGRKRLIKSRLRCTYWSYGHPCGIFDTQDVVYFLVMRWRTFTPARREIVFSRVCVCVYRDYQNQTAWVVYPIYPTHHHHHSPRWSTH